MDRFEAMALLREVADRGSFSAAGRALRIPMPTLSRKISDLESLLGTRLLTRTTRRLALTDAGVTYLAAARRILEAVDEAEREAGGEFTTPKGDLVVTAPLHFGRLHVLPVVADFLALYPNVNVHLLLSDRNVHLVDDHVDIAVRIGSLPDSTLVATRVGSMRTVVCASPDLLARHDLPASPPDLQGCPVIAVEAPMPRLTWRFRQTGSALPIDVPVVPRLSVTTSEAAAAAAIRGVGFTRLFFYQVAEAVEAGLLQIVLEAFEPDPAPIHLVHAAAPQMPLKVRRFADVAAPRLRERLAQLLPAGESSPSSKHLP